jgi:hypothetical protein
VQLHPWPRTLDTPRRRVPHRAHQARRPARRDEHALARIRRRADGVAHHDGRVRAAGRDAVVVAAVQGGRLGGGVAGAGAVALLRVAVAVLYDGGLLGGLLVVDGRRARGLVLGAAEGAGRGGAGARDVEGDVDLGGVGMGLQRLEVFCEPGEVLCRLLAELHNVKIGGGVGGQLLTLRPRRPDEDDILRRRSIHPLEEINREADGIAGAAAACNEHDLVVLQGVREGAVGPLDGGAQAGARVRGGVGVQGAREAVVLLDDELERLRRDDGEGVRLEAPDRRQPEEAVLARDGARGLLGEDDTRAAVGERPDRGLVVDAIDAEPGKAEQPVGGPHAAGKAGDDGDLLVEVVAVEADGDDGGHHAQDVHDVEGLVGEAADDEGGGDGDEDGEGGDNAGRLLGRLQRLQLAAGHEVRGVGDGVAAEHQEDGAAGDLVQVVQPLVGVGRQKGQGRVLQGEEDQEADVGDQDPTHVS